jgi:hypothetical protein
MFADIARRKDPAKKIGGFQTEAVPDPRIGLNVALGIRATSGPAARRRIAESWSGENGFER